MTKVHDISVTLRPFGMESRDVEVTPTGHAEAARLFARQHGLRVSQLPCHSFFSTERVQLGTHDGTHLDAPYHFFPTSEGKPAKLIHEVPLDWAFGDGLILDFRHKPPHDAITEYDVAGELERIGRPPKPGEIVMLWVGGTDRFDYDPTFNEAASGLNGGALNYLFRFGVKVMSTDSATIDIPIRIMRERLLAGDKAAYFPIHRAGRLTEWTHAEKLANMGSLAGSSGFKVMLFPIKIQDATGAWSRAVAIEDEWLEGHPVELVDLSLPIMDSSFESEPSKLHTVHHGMGRRRNAKAMGIKSFDVAHGSAMDTIDTYTHAGTHVDAPAHFAAGKATAEQLPLEWFYGEGLLLDFSGGKKPGDRIALGEVQAAVERSGGLAPGMIPVIRTGAADAFDDDPNFTELSVALDVDAFQWLLDQGVQVVGCDAESIDGPVAPMVEALRGGRQDAFFPIHCLGRQRDFCLIHKMDLRGLGGRRRGFKVAAFPIKLEGCGASWTRAVALVPGG